MPPNDIEFSGERKRVRCNEGLTGATLATHVKGCYRRQDVGLWVAGAQRLHLIRAYGELVERLPEPSE